jgi:CheY-like chemotaxis protein
LKILIVEDEALIAMMVEDILEELGHEVVGTANGVKRGVDLASALDIDLAVLDINLGRETSFPIADVLNQRRIPFFFATGYGLAGLEEPYLGTLTIKKPFGRDDLANAIAQLAPEAHA